VSREALLAALLSRLEPMLAQLASQGFQPFEEEYCRHWLHSDQQVRAEAVWVGPWDRAHSGDATERFAAGTHCCTTPLLLLRLGTLLGWRPALLAALPQVELEEGEQRIPVTIRGLSPSGYLLVRAAAAQGAARCGDPAPAWNKGSAAWEACAGSTALAAAPVWLLPPRFAAHVGHGHPYCRPRMRRVSGTSCTPTATASTSFVAWSAASCRSEEGSLVVHVQAFVMQALAML
jgi:hypothetical protein